MNTPKPALSVPEMQYTVKAFLRHRNASTPELMSECGWPSSDIDGFVQTVLQPLIDDRRIQQVPSMQWNASMTTWELIPGQGWFSVFSIDDGVEKECTDVSTGVSPTPFRSFGEASAYAEKMRSQHPGVQYEVRPLR